MKQYKQISKVEALQLIIDNNGNAVGGLAFRDNSECTWRIAKLSAVNCDQNSGLHFSTPNATYYQCAIVEEVADPDPFKQFCDFWSIDTLQFASPTYLKAIVKQAYEIGQKNPIEEDQPVADFRNY